MTHTMHRKAPSGQGDYVLHLRAAGEAKLDSAPKIRKILEAVLPLGPVAWGGPAMGSSLRDNPLAILSGVKDGMALHLTFDCPEKFGKAIEICSKLSLGQSGDGSFGDPWGLSLSVSAPLDQTLSLARELGLDPQGFQLDLGQVLPPGPGLEEDPILSLSSLCGHMRISRPRARRLAKRIAQGRIGSLEAAGLLGKACRCGCFNLTAAAACLELESKKMHPMAWKALRRKSRARANGSRL